MVTKTTVIKKIVCDGKKQYRLTYNLLTEHDSKYGMEVICQWRNVTETEQIQIGSNRNDALRILRLFAKESVFPVALLETWENL